MRCPDYIVNWLMDLVESIVCPKFPGNVEDLKSPKSPHKPCHKPVCEKKKKKLY